MHEKYKEGGEKMTVQACVCEMKLSNLLSAHLTGISNAADFCTTLSLSSSFPPSSALAVPPPPPLSSTSDSKKTLRGTQAGSDGVNPRHFQNSVDRAAGHIVDSQRKEILCMHVRERECVCVIVFLCVFM